MTDHKNRWSVPLLLRSSVLARAKFSKIQRHHFVVRRNRDGRISCPPRKTRLPLLPPRSEPPRTRLPFLFSKQVLDVPSAVEYADNIDAVSAGHIEKEVCRETRHRNATHT